MIMLLKQRISSRQIPSRSPDHDSQHGPQVVAWFDRCFTGGTEGAARNPLKDQDEVSAHPEKKKLACHYCLNPVTTQDCAISVAGSHRHSQCNPHGCFFHFACFSAAPGCRLVGDSVITDSWFDGYTWQIANCRHCQLHLGWYFSGQSPTFFGLLHSRLTPTLHPP